MSNALARTICTCTMCGKKYSVQTSDYKKRMAKSKSGLIFCSRECTRAYRSDAQRIKINLHLDTLPHGTKIDANTIAMKLSSRQVSITTRGAGNVLKERSDFTRINNDGVWVKA